MAALRLSAMFGIVCIPTPMIHFPAISIISFPLDHPLEQLRRNGL